MWQMDSQRPIVAAKSGCKWLAVAACCGCLFHLNRADATVVPAAQSIPPGAAVATVAAEGPDLAIPTTLDRVGRIVTEVRIGSQGPFRFIIDTGANRSAVAERTARALNLTPDGQALVHGITGSSVMPQVTVTNFSAGELRFESQRLAVLPDRVFGEVDGILGIDTLQHARIEVDFTADKVLLRKGGRAASRNHQAVKVTVRHRGLLLIPARIGQLRLKAIIDTGAERSLGNPALMAAMLARYPNSSDSGTSAVVGATAQVELGRTIVAPPVDLGAGAHIGNLPVTFGDFHVFKVWSLRGEPALVIGMDVLGTLPELVIDYQRKELQLDLRLGRAPAS